MGEHGVAAAYQPLIGGDSRSGTTDVSGRLLLSALAAFSKRGYHAATTREIAEAAGLSPAAVYVHYRSKEELLSVISRTGHGSVLMEVKKALASASDEPRERVRRFIQTFAQWHATNHELARVIQHDLRSLPRREFRRAAMVRRTIHALLRDELFRGIEQGTFETADLEATTIAALSLCIDLSRWYQQGGRYSAERIGELYADLVLRMISRPDGGPSV